METALGNLAGKLTGLLVALSIPVGMLWLGWGTFKALLTGGAERAVQALVVRAILMGVLLAALLHLSETFALVQLLGGALFQTIGDAIRGAF
jgi:hypothetical protein